MNSLSQRNYPISIFNCQFRFFCFKTWYGLFSKSVESLTVSWRARSQTSVFHWCVFVQLFCLFLSFHWLFVSLRYHLHYCHRWFLCNLVQISLLNNIMAGLFPVELCGVLQYSRRNFRTSFFQSRFSALAYTIISSDTFHWPSHPSNAILMQCWCIDGTHNSPNINFLYQNNPTCVAKLVIFPYSGSYSTWWKPNFKSKTQ